ncbi:MAG: dihydroflavonol-4-reductase [bacterium P3]|nr:MAG: dihydroflavonol-4-reductase [bacterium P3]KWW41031.1 MAG: dihydroflavonol-4-reductase [bacterium F083]
MKILLLGGSGLLGQNVLYTLLQRRYEVVLLLRAGSVAPDPAPGLAVLRGSLLCDADLETAASGCQAIINCAGTTDMSLLRLADYLPVNRDLCGRLVQLMERCGITTLVHVSTANTVGYGRPGHPAAEDAPAQPPFSHSFYTRSKRAGEELLIAAARRHSDWHVVLLNPGFIVGSYDAKPSSGRLLLAAYRRRLMAVPGGGKSFVHAADVAVAAANALTMGRSGERYLATGDNLSLRQFYLLQARLCGYRQRCLVLPGTLLLLVGWLGDMLRAVGVRTQLSSCNVRQLMVREYYCAAKAHAQLDMPCTPVEQAILDFHRWRRGHVAG